MAGKVEVKVDGRQITAACKDLAKMAPAMTAQLPTTMQRSARPVADAIKKAAGFSKRIPGAVQVVRAPRPGATGAAVAVVVDAAAAPNAAPINNRDHGGTFDHPVYGHDVKVSQAAHPFMPAGQRAAAASEQQLIAAMQVAERKAGFR